MKIDLNALGGRSKHVETSFNEPELELGLEHVRLFDSALFAGDVSGDSVLANVNGTITAAFEIECTRCLELVQYTLPIVFSAEFVASEHFGSEGEHEIDPHNLSANSIDEDQLDLADIVREQILLNLPEQVFCLEDCKGLCETCGVNRNLQDCNCIVEDVDPRWSALKDLK